MPSIMEHDDELDDMMLFPITDLDGEDDQCNNNDNHNLNNEINSQNLGKSASFNFKPAMSLRQRRWSKIGLHLSVAESDQLETLHLNIAQAQKPNIPMPIRQEPDSPISVGSSSPKMNWLKAFKKIRSLKDPWAKFNIDALPTERVTRHRFNALKKKWVVDEVQVKMESEAFNHGAMRACFRLKKSSTFVKKTDWKHAHNYVAKLYFENVERDVYFEDVKLQMDAKLWGEEYNRHNPPKKVDIFQMCVIEFIDRPDKPLYHLEHYIEGDYIKYNSNSGFVEESQRLTPQAFSHFTFERSGHELIVVDIQGVGDLWTDPQIHTSEGEGYGDGNLGTKGMALFFHSHMCNSICESLGLDSFDLSPNESEKYEKMMQKARQMRRCMTMVRGCEEHVSSPSPQDRGDLHAFLMRHRSRTISNASSNFSDISEDSDQPMKSANTEDDNSPRFTIGGLEEEDEDEETGEEPMSPGSPLSAMMRKPSRVRFLSETEDSSTLTTEEERIKFQEASKLITRSSSVANEMSLRNLSQDRLDDQRIANSILGAVHHDMAKYHEIGRFKLPDEETDVDSALYHEAIAADLGVKEAILTMANLHLGLPRDVLAHVTMEENDENINKGVAYMEYAAQIGDRSAMVYMAKAFETGDGLGSCRTRSYKKSVYWYEKAISTTQEDECGEYDATMDNPTYLLKAKVAELYLADEYELEKDASYAGECYTEAAEAAMACMKGRLANKYYALAEEAWAQIEE